MFFEGSEKKLEIVLEANSPPLRLRDIEFWNELVSAAQAKILSRIDSDSCTAFLLSESSLFVWDDRITLITCGQTTLVKAAAFFLSHYTPDNIKSLIYERKNEYLPQQQQTDFYLDVSELKKKVNGRAFRFGNLHEHHVYLFHMNKSYMPSESDSTLELLMYDLDRSILETFRRPKVQAKELRDLMQVEALFPDFIFDDFVFDPFGYSLNALKGDQYFTVHVTPQDLGCYVSFEANFQGDCDYNILAQNIVEVFRPKSFDIVHFQPGHCKNIPVSGYEQRSLVEENLNCGYCVFYSHYFKPSNQPQSAHEYKEF